MKIVHPCPHCDAIFVFPREKALTLVSCERCGARFRVQNRFLQYAVTSAAGAGTGTIYYHAVEDHSHRNVILEFLPPAALENPDYVSWIEGQAALMGAYHHPHATEYLGILSYDGEMCVLWGDTETSTLASLLRTEKQLPEKFVLNFMIDLAEALKVAAELGYFHGAIIPARIQFDQSRVARLVGIGFPYPQSDEVLREEDAEYYVAPECLDEIGDSRSDIYGLGACMFHALFGYHPIPITAKNSIDTLRRMKKNSIYVPSSHLCSETTVQLLRRMLAADPDARISNYDDLLQFLQEARECCDAPKGAGSQRLKEEAAALAKKKKLMKIGALACGVVIACFIALFLAQKGSRSTSEMTSPATTTKTASDKVTMQAAGPAPLEVKIVSTAPNIPATNNGAGLSERGATQVEDRAAPGDNSKSPAP